MPIETRIESRILEIKLNSPQNRNALGPIEAQDLKEALASGGCDEAVNVIVLTASEPCFSAGGNLRAIMEIARAGQDSVRTAVYEIFQGLFRTIEGSTIPIVAAVDGAAIGVGADLALAADVTYIGSNGSLNQGWMRLGLIPATGGTEYVRRRAGRSGVWQFLAGEKIGSVRAQELGLAIAAENALEAAMELARTLGSMSRRQIVAVRKLSRITNVQEHLKVALEYQVDFLVSDDFIDRASSIMNSRRPG